MHFKLGVFFNHSLSAVFKEDWGKKLLGWALVDMVGRVIINIVIFLTGLKSHAFCFL